MRVAAQGQNQVKVHKIKAVNQSLLQHFAIILFYKYGCFGLHIYVYAHVHVPGIWRG